MYLLNKEISMTHPIFYLQTPQLHLGSHPFSFWGTAALHLKINIHIFWTFSWSTGSGKKKKKDLNNTLTYWLFFWFLVHRDGTEGSPWHFVAMILRQIHLLSSLLCSCLVNWNQTHFPYIHVEPFQWNKCKNNNVTFLRFDYAWSRSLSHL